MDIKRVGQMNRISEQDALSKITVHNQSLSNHLWHIFVLSLCGGKNWMYDQNKYYLFYQSCYQG